MVEIEERRKGCESIGVRGFGCFGWATSGRKILFPDTIPRHKEYTRNMRPNELLPHERIRIPVFQISRRLTPIVLGYWEP